MLKRVWSGQALFFFVQKINIEVIMFLLTGGAGLCGMWFRLKGGNGRKISQAAVPEYDFHLRCFSWEAFYSLITNRWNGIREMEQKKKKNFISGICVYGERRDWGSFILNWKKCKSTRLKILGAKLCGSAESRRSRLPWKSGTSMRRTGCGGIWRRDRRRKRGCYQGPLQWAGRDVLER